MSTSAVSATSSNKQVLSQDDFLQLMVAQLTSQDPLNPTKDTDFAAQLAQFSALEQTKAIGSDVSALGAGQQVTEAQSLLGKNVVITTKEGTVGGVVQSVVMVDGAPKLNVGGTLYNLSDVTGITPSN